MRTGWYREVAVKSMDSQAVRVLLIARAQLISQRQATASKCGDGLLRSYLFEAANVLLSRITKPSWLKTWGQALTQRIGARKAKVAVARKLAVVLHRMWRDSTEFRWEAKPAR